MAKKKKVGVTFRNLEYRLRTFRDSLPELLEDIIRSKEDVIVAAIANDQLYRRGITGTGEKIMSYAPYSPRTIKAKLKKGQPTTRVTLRDSGDFHRAMHLVFDTDGFYITSEDKKTPFLVSKYGPAIFELTRENLNRIVRAHIRKELVRRLKNTVKL